MLCHMTAPLAHRRLADALDRSGRTRAETARRLGIHETHLSKICKGERRPSLELAVKLERLTFGMVRCVDWIPAAPDTAAA